MNLAATADRESSQLVIIDIQERLCGVMEQQALASTLKNCSILLQAADLLQTPTIYTEQYPKGLGPTVPELMQWLGPMQRVEKTCFSCCDSSDFRTLLENARPQVILAGMEAHICVLQTALQLLGMGKEVFVVEDAVLSRSPANQANALHRLRQAGAIVSNTESVVFEWLQVAEGEAFKQISKLVK